jgi:hypothetical protein
MGDRDASAHGGDGVSSRAWRLGAVVMGDLHILGSHGSGEGRSGSFKLLQGRAMAIEEEAEEAEAEESLLCVCFLWIELWRDLQMN